MSGTKDSYIKIKKPYRNRARTVFIIFESITSTGDGRYKNRKLR